jgi:peptidoglycan/LPS O-acetylase OafA/YrhL
MTSSQHIPALDGWRGLAIVLVLAGHFWMDPVLPGFSAFGVDLFFVLSGRLMADILFLKRMPLAQFYLRRFARVYPALLVFMVLAASAFWSFQPGHTVAAVIFVLTFTLNYAIASGALPFTVFDHIWSLCVEEHSYILLGLIAFLCRSLHRSGAAALMLAAGLAAMAGGIIQLDVFHYSDFYVLWRTDVAMSAILLSASLFLLCPAESIGAFLPWLTPIGLSVAALAQFSYANAFITFGCEILCLAIAAIGIEHSTAWFRGILERQPLRFLGRCSFSIYLWQQPFYKIASSGRYSHALLMAAGVVIGILGYYAVERPARSVLNAVFARWLGDNHVFRKSPVSP